MVVDSADTDRVKQAQVVGLDQRQLLMRHVNGDPNAFRELVSIFRSPLYTYLIRFGLSEHESEDLFQEIFLKIHKASRTYNSNRPLAPWIFTIAANTVKSFYRKKKVEELIPDTEQIKQEGIDSSSEEEAEAKETAGWLRDAIAKLPLSQREALLLCAQPNMEQKEVARLLGIPSGTLKTLVRRARLSLAKSLAKRKAIIDREVLS